MLFLNGIRVLPGGAEVCDYKNEYVHVGYNVMNWVQLVMYPIIPLLIIFFCNVLIVIKAKRAKTLRRELYGQSDDATRADKDVDKLSKMLLFVSIFFFVTTLPLACFFFWQHIQQANGNHLDPLIMVLGLTVSVWHNLNNACNFFLYVASDGAFRQELGQMLKCSSSRMGDTCKTSVYTLYHSKAESSVSVGETGDSGVDSTDSKIHSI